MMQMLELIYKSCKGKDLHDSGNDRNDCEGTKMGMIRIDLWACLVFFLKNFNSSYYQYSLICLIVF